MTEQAAPSLSVIIPAYNEEARLPDALDEVTAYLDANYPDAELIIASDGSTDDTEAITREFAAQSPRVRLLSLPHRGKGHAVKRGMLEAKGDARLFMDVDLAVPVETIKPFVEATRDADVVIGSRAIAGAERSGEPLSRRLGGRVVGRATRLILGLVRLRYPMRVQGVPGGRRRAALQRAARRRLRVRRGDTLSCASVGNERDRTPRPLALRRDEHRSPPPRAADAGGDSARAAAQEALTLATALTVVRQYILD